MAFLMTHAPTMWPVFKTVSRKMSAETVLLGPGAFLLRIIPRFVERFITFCRRRGREGRGEGRGEERGGRYWVIRDENFRLVSIAFFHVMSHIKPTHHTI